MINNKPIIYYKNGQLNKTRTVKSILKYYIKCKINNKPVYKPKFQSVID